ncbi:hypothetical protein ACX3T8_10620 [Corynebacterium pyruviciproducens]
MAFRKSKKQKRKLGEKENTLQRLSAANAVAMMMAEASKDLEVELPRLVSEIREKCHDLDLAQVINGLKMYSYVSTTWPRPDQPEFSLSLLDVAALVLYAEKSPGRKGNPLPSIDTGDVWGILQEIASDLLEIRMRYMLGNLSRLSDKTKGNQLNAIHIAALQVIRETSYASMQADIYVRLFGDEKIDALIKADRNYSFEQVLQVMRSAESYFKTGISEAIENLEKSRESHVATRGDGVSEGEELARNLFAPNVEKILLSVEDLSRQLSLDAEAVRHILDDFSLDLSEFSIEDVCACLLESNLPLLDKPFVREREGRYLVADESLLIPAIKRNFESFLLQNSLYSQFRGDLVENLVVQEFEQYLPEATVKSGLKYVLKGGKRGEADVLVLLGDVALVIEVKSATMYAPGPGKTSGGLFGKMRKNIGKASEQVEQLRRYIQEEHEIPLEKGGVLHLDGIKEVHSIVVTLEDLLEVATQTGDLLDAKIISSESEMPWIVSLNDLRLIIKLADDPAEFLTYLRRRRDPLIVRKYFAMDELDLFLRFRETGLWAEDEVDSLLMDFVVGDTRELDAWFYELTDQKPTIKDQPLLKYARQSRALGLDHWLEFGATLLSIAEDNQEIIAETIKSIQEATRIDLSPHSYTTFFGQDGYTRFSTLLVFATQRPVGRYQVQKEHLSRYLAAAKTTYGATRGFACVINFDGTIKDIIYEGRSYKKSDFSKEELETLIVPERLPLFEDGTTPGN